MWTAIDNISDTQSAIEEYKLANEFSRLSLYGLLQAMVVQQDAIEHLEKAMNITCPNWKKDYPGLSKIRKIRNATVGHPISIKKGEEPSYTSISYSHSSDTLEYGTWFKKDFMHQSINIVDTINTQRNLISKEIDRIMKKIKDDEMEHRKQFNDTSLSKLLSPSGYYIEKLWSFERSREHAQVCFESLKSIYDSFKDEIKKRYKISKIDEQGVQIPGLILTVQHLEKIIPRIEKMILMTPNVDLLDLEVYVESLNKSFDELRTMSKEIDDEFINFNKQK